MLYEVRTFNNLRGEECYFLPMGEARIDIKVGNASPGLKKIENNGRLSKMTPGELKYLNTGAM